MADVPSTVSTLNGLFKTVYAAELKNLVPKQNKLTKAVSFAMSKRVGESYRQPVALTQENGITYAAPNSGAYDLEDSSALNTKESTVTPSQMTIRSTISVEAAQRSMSSIGAFKQATGLVVTSMIESLSRRLEIQLWYGSSAKGIGTVASTANVDATHTTMTFTAGQFAHGIWVGSTGARLDTFDSTGSQLNTNAALVVTGVDVVNKTVTVSGAAADITAIDAATVNVPHVLRFRGALNNEMVGLDTISTNTSTLFGIDGANYDLWNGNSYSAGAAALDFTKIIDAVATASNRGLEDDVVAYVNPAVWTALASDQAALRVFDSSYKEGGQGTLGNRSLRFYSQNGVIDIEPASCVKEGEVFILPPSKFLRIGSTEVTMDVPGRQGQYFDLIPGKNGYELRAYVAQALFTHAPNMCVKMTNFTY